MAVAVATKDAQMFSSHLVNFDSIWLENTPSNNHVHKRQHINHREGNQENQNHFGRNVGHYNNNHNVQKKYVPPSRRYLDWQCTKNARVTPYSKRPTNRDVQSQSSSGEQSDDGEKQHYLNDLIQYVQRWYNLLDNSRHQPKPSRWSSHEWDNQSRRSNSERVNRDTKKSSKASGWDIKKPNTSSKSGLSSNPHSDSDNKPFVANKVPSSHTRKTNINASTSTSSIPESTNSPSIKSSIKSHQRSKVNKSIVAQSLAIKTPSSKISSTPTEVESMEVLATVTSTSARKVPSSNTQQTNTNLSTSISNIPESALPANASQSNIDNSIVAQSNDLLSMTITAQSISILSEPSNVLPSSDNVGSMELSPTLTSTESEPTNNVSPPSVINQSVDLLEELVSNKRKPTDVPPTSPTSVVIELTGTVDHIEYSANSSFDKVSSPAVDLSTKLNIFQTKPSDVPHSSSASELVDLMEILGDTDCYTISVLEKDDMLPARSMPLINQEHTSPSIRAPTAIYNFDVPVKPSHNMNRKRSFNSCGATKSSDHDSSAGLKNAQQPDANEVPAKKSIHSTIIPATTTEQYSRSGKSTAIIEHSEERNNNMIGKPIVPTTTSSNKNQSDSVHPIVSTTTLSKNVLQKSVKCVNNEIVSEKTEIKADLHRKDIDKKSKKFLIEKKESKVDKPIIFKKNHIEQFKFILKIMKARSSSWSLSYSSDINVTNFCDAIHHFEKQSDKICALTEVKFFDDTSKANKINYKNLFGDEFNIQRYFGIFYKYEHSYFSNKHSKFVIMTNREIDIALFNNNGIRVSYKNDSYTLKVKQPYDESKIYKKCLECFVLPKLAELLYEFVRSDRKVPHFNTELIRKYHLALVKEKVLQIVDDTKSRERIAKFHPHFIQGIELSNAAIELRYHVEKLLHGLPTESMKFRVGNKDFGEDVASMRYSGTVDKLPDENCKATFEHFFEIFEIIKIRKLSDEMITRELGEKFLKLKDPVYFNAVQVELLIFLKNYGLKSDILESLKHTISKLEITEKNLRQPHRHIDIKFEQETFANLSRAIQTKDIILCSTDSLLLSELKMRQFSNNQESLFVTEKILFEMTDDVVSEFSHRSTNLLVIVWEENVVTDCKRSKKIEGIIERLRDVTNNSQGKKKSVIIANKCNINLLLLCEQIFRIDEDLTFKSLNDHFKSIKISLQQRTLQLSDIADNDAINSLIKNPKILETFLIEEVKIGRALSKPSGFKEKLYDFKLNQRVIINPKIFQENINDVFLISSIDCENFYLDYKPSDRVVYLSDSQSKITHLTQNAKYFILDCNVNPIFISNKIKNKNIHQLSYESNNFIWKSTSGSSAALLKYRISNDEDYVTFTIEDILNNGPKTVIMSGESGMGKSVCLYDFANRANEEYEQVWIIQVDLNKPLKNTLKGYPIETSENAIHFLSDYLDLKDEQKELFIMSEQGQLKIKLMLFVDGYDDVYENIDLMTNLLQHLQHSKIEKMFVTSRTDKLEKILGTFSYSLQFGSEEKFQFANKFCIGKNFKYNLAGKIKLLNTPLHMKMYMELCQKKPEKSCIDNLYDLYKSYAKLYLSSNKLKSAYKFSAQKLLTENELEEIGVTIENVDLELPEELSRKSVIEYFTAEWLSKRHLNTKKYIDNLIEHTSSVFLNVYVSAYNTKKKNKISVNEYAKYGFLRSLKAILELDNTNKPCLCRLIRKGKSKTKEVLQFLLEFYNDTGCREFIQHIKYVDTNLVKYVNQQVKGQTPLQIAAEKNKVDLGCELVLKGADMSVLVPPSNFITSMATYATKELANGNTRLGPIAVILLERSPQATAYLDINTELPKVLPYLFSRGHVGLIEQLLLLRVPDNQDRRKLLESIVEGKTLLDHVNESEIINDEERLKLIKYLEKNLDGRKFLKSNIDSILQSACNHGHEATFNYYITYSKSSIDVLHEALRSNDEKIINFLMRDSKRTRDSNGNNPLHQAIILGVSRKTINYLLGKVGINDINNAGETVLHLAFKEGANLSTIQFLIDAGASLTVSNKLGFYPWIVAIKDESSRYCKEEQRELMSYLQTKNVRFPDGKNSNHVFDKTRQEILPKLVYFKNLDDYNVDYDDNGNSHLHAALPCPDEKNWCIFLINHGADVNIVKDGKSAFYLALEYGCYDVAKLMLQHGAIIDKIDKTGKTLLDYLNPKKDSNCVTIKEILSLAYKIFENSESEENQLNIIQLVDSSTIDNSYFRYLLTCRDKNGSTLLHIAACRNDSNIIDHLYQFSKKCQFRYKDFVPMDVNAIDSRGNTSLHLAAQKNDKCVAKLLSIGARFRMTNLDGKKPMDLTVSGSSVKKWLQAAEDLFKLIEQKNVEDVRKLLKTYAEVLNSRDNSGKSPLHLARDEELMKLLLANKYVDVNALDDEQKPPIYHAVNENYLDGVKLLLKAAANYEFKGIQNINNEASKLLQKIDELFDDINSHEPRFFAKGNHWAFENQLNDIVNTFGITRDVIVNVRDSQRNSLLHYAAKYNYVDVAENLLMNGAIYNSRNKDGKTPMELTINIKPLLKSIDDLFVTKNLDVNIAVNCRRSGGFTLLHKAILDDNSETFKWLVERGADINATTNNSVEVRIPNQTKIAEWLNR